MSAALSLPNEKTFPSGTVNSLSSPYLIIPSISLLSSPAGKS
jgi:hypothetical protein